MEIAGTDYIIGQDRNDETLVAHLYQGDMKNPGNPMCVRGWNRSDGKGYSIFRNIATGGICMICLRRANEKRPSVPSRYHKTKWI